MPASFIASHLRICRKNQKKDPVSNPISSESSTESFDSNNVKDKRLLSILENNSSKAVDKVGKPLVVYHGTFDRNATGQFSIFNTPAFFSSDKETARIISRDLANEALGKLNEKYKIKRPEGARGYVYPVYLNIRKPKYIDFKGKAWGSDYKLTQEFEDAVAALKNSDEYDGVIALNIIEGGNNKIGTVTTTYAVISVH